MPPPCYPGKGVVPAIKARRRHALMPPPFFKEGGGGGSSYLPGNHQNSPAPTGAIFQPTRIRHPSAQRSFYLFSHDLQIRRHIFGQRVEGDNFAVDGGGDGLGAFGVKLGLDENNPGFGGLGLLHKGG